MVQALQEELRFPAQYFHDCNVSVVGTVLAEEGIAVIACNSIDFVVIVAVRVVFIVVVVVVVVAVVADRTDGGSGGSSCSSTYCK